MESAERKGSALRRLLRSADRFSEAAIALGSRLVNTPSSSVSASLCSVTACDQRRALLPRLLAFRALPPRRFDAVVFRAMGHPHRDRLPPHHGSTHPDLGGSSITRRGPTRLAPSAREVGEWIRFPASAH